MKRLIAVAAALTLALGGCSAKNNFDESRGRGDAGVGNIDDSKKDVIQFPDRFFNVSHACDGHGHRIFVSTKSDHTREIAVIADATCGG